MSRLPGDAMSDALSLVRMTADLVCLGDYAAPWGLSFHRPLAHFHIVLDGSACLLAEGMEPLLLATGDLVLLPHGLGHVLASGPGVPTVPVDQSVAASAPVVPFEHRLEGPGARSRLICGRFGFAGALAPRMMAVLPRLIHVPGRAANPQDGLNIAARFLLYEAQNPTPGSAIMISRLMDLIFIQAVRDWGRRSPTNLSWLGGLGDAQIGRALSAIHRDPARPWSVAALAAEAGLSRSAFAIRFAEVVGQTPLRYVTSWRLDRAADYLRGGTARIAEIATLTGYGSEPAMSRAFKQQFGVSPAQYRRDAAGPRPS